jgi:uncharacterized protein YvpB
MKIKQITIVLETIAAIGVVIIIFITKEYFYQEQLQARRIPALNSVNSVNKETDDEIIKIPISFKVQEHALTCEVASLRMSLNYFGIDVTEDELLEKLNFDTKEPLTSENIWGDPNLGFVGDIDGSIFLGTGYGVHEKPILDLALNYTKASIIEKANLSKVLEEVNKGYPVIVWGLLSNRKPVYWQTKQGKQIKAFPGEHARIVMGYSGDISNPNKIILMDPKYGKILMDKDKFLVDWKTLENRALVIYGNV